MPLPFTFAGLSSAQMSDLDANFSALGALTAIPCTVSGTNTLVLTPLGDTPTIAAYTDYQAFSGIAAATNSGAATAQVGGLAALPVYKDTSSGPVALAGGESVIGNAIILSYDSALNTGSGGFHLVGGVMTPGVGAAPATVTSAVGTTLSAAVLTGSGTGQAVILRTGSASGSFNDVTDTAAAIVAALPGCGINTYFRFRVINSTGHTQTVTAGSGVTIAGTATTATTHDFVAIVTALGTPAVTVYG